MPSRCDHDCPPTDPPRRYIVTFKLLSLLIEALLVSLINVPYLISGYTTHVCNTERSGLLSRRLPDKVLQYICINLTTCSMSDQHCFEESIGGCAGCRLPC